MDFPLKRVGGLWNCTPTQHFFCTLAQASQFIYVTLSDASW
jgi:hypothetical protein